MVMGGRCVGVRQPHVRKDPWNSEIVASMGNLSWGTSQVPEVTVPVDCIPTDKCTLGKGSCGKIRDRFLHIQPGTQDMLNTLKNDAAELLRSCQEGRTIVVPAAASCASSWKTVLRA